MKKAFLFIILVVIFGVVTSPNAQTLSKDAVLQNSGGNRVTLGTPASVTNNKILLPGTLGSQGAILYISSVASTTGTTAWLNPGSNGDVLTLSGGIPTWSAPSGGGSGWGLTGNSGTTAGTNFIGTTDAKDWVVKTNSGGTGGERMRVDLEGQVGIGNIQPKVMMDIKGGLATRSGVITLSNGTNNNVYIGDTSYIRLSGLTGAATITGFRNGYDGKMLTVFNTTPYVVTFAHQSSSSIDTTRILNVIGQGGNVAIQDSGIVDLRYDGTMSRWVMTNIRGAVSNISTGAAYFARTSADTTITTSAALAVVNELTISMQPNVIHTIDGVFYVDASSSNPDVAFAFNVPNDFSLMKVTLTGFGDNGANVTEGTDVVTGDFTASTAINVGASNGGTFILVHGILINGPTAGDFNVAWNRAATGGNITLKAGSYIRLIPVGSN